MQDNLEAQAFVAQTQTDGAPAPFADEQLKSEGLEVVMEGGRPAVRKVSPDGTPGPVVMGHKPDLRCAAGQPEPADRAAATAADPAPDEKEAPWQAAQKLDALQAAAAAASTLREPSAERGCCLGCGASSRADGRPLVRCAQCKAAWFCGTDCQRLAWPNHKEACCAAARAASVAPKRWHEVEL